MAKLRVIKEMFLYLKENKKLFLIPFLVLLVLILVVVLFAQSQAIAPFIYSLF